MLATYIAWMSIALIWGYFSELKKGYVGLFIGRLVFMNVVFLLLNRSNLF